MKRSECFTIIVLLIISAYQIFTIGYGNYEHIQYRTEQAIKDNKCYTSEHLTVIYERTINTATDFLHLQIDSTYRKIGKGQFVYEMICDRKLALLGASGEHFSADEAKQCFIEGAERSWTKIDRHKSICGYNCWAAATSDNRQGWQAWYTTELPHCSDGAKVTDGLKGLIMMLKSSDGDYSLRVATIDTKRG